MLENTHLGDCLDEIDLDFVERERTPRLLMKLSIPIHLAGLSLSNTVSILETFGAQRGRATVHNWVHKAELQSEDGRNPNHIAVDETVIRLNDERYWLYAAIDLDTNGLLHTKLKPARTNVLAHAFFAELRGKHDVSDAVVLVDGTTPLQDAYRRHGLDSKYEKHGLRNSAENIYYKVKFQTSSLSNCFSNAKEETADRWLKSFAFAWNRLI